MSFVIQYHPALATIIHQEKETLQALMDWCRQNMSELPVRDQTKTFLLPDNRGGMRIETRSDQINFRMTLGKVSFHHKRISIAQEFPAVMCEGMVGKKIGEVIDLPCDDVITRVMYAGMQTHLLSESEPLELRFD